jgi:hypothetical protein
MGDSGGAVFPLLAGVLSIMGGKQGAGKFLEGTSFSGKSYNTYVYSKIASVIARRCHHTSKDKSEG